MSKQKFPRELANEVARQISVSLAPITERLVVAGSIRRRKEWVGDAEILYVPKYAVAPDDLFTGSRFDLVELALESLVQRGDLARRPSVRGTFTWGPLNKLALHHSGLPVDLFATTEERWWVSLVVRTGGKAMNLELATSARKLGRSLNAYGAGVSCADGTVIPATSEEHVFDLCGVRYRAPWERP